MYQRFNHILHFFRLVIAVLKLLICLIISTSLFAQKQQTLKFTHITHKEGLLHSQIESLLEDQKGFLWIGTEDALSKYDGYKVIHYRNKPGDSLSISSNRIRAIAEDQQGNLWVGTEGSGLNNFIQNTQEFIRYKSDPNSQFSLSNDVVREIFVDKNNNVWVGTADGLCKLIQKKTVVEKEKFKIYRNNNESEGTISNNTINKIIEDKEGNIWIGTDNGLNRINPKTNQIKVYKPIKGDKSSLKGYEINALFIDDKNRFWIGTEAGICFYDFLNDNFIPLYSLKDSDRISDNRVWAIGQDHAGTIWVGTQKGLNQLISEDPENGFVFKPYYNDPLNDLSIGSDIIQCFYPSISGVFWIGTREGGVSKLDYSNQKFVHFSNSSRGKIKLNEKSIWSFLEDKEGILWVGTRAGGLNKLNLATNEVTYYKRKNNIESLSTNYIWDIMEDNQGVIWIGNYGGGIDKLNKEDGTFTRNVDLKTGIRSIVDIHEDKNGYFWVASYGQGIGLFDKKNGKYLKIDTKGIKNFTDIYESKNGNIWFGTDGSGFVKYDHNTEKYTYYKKEPGNKNSLINNTVWSICETDGYLWLGTNGGIDRLSFKNDNIEFKHYSEDEGLNSNLVYGVVNDDDDNVWLGTANGLSRLNPKTEIFKNYDVKDGLQSNEFNAGVVYKNHKGEIFFGGINGFNKFDPADLANNNVPPKIFITDFKLANKSVKVNLNPKDDNSFYLNKPISETEKLILNYDQSFFSFDFVAINYKQSNKNQYAYYLEGLEEDWNYSFTRREAYYTNVPHGQYTFKVKASNNDGIWNEEGVSLKIIITPPFWDTLWFKFSMAFLVIGGSILYYKMRMASIKRINIRLEKQVTERTAEVVAQKDEIKQQAEELEQQRDNLSIANKSISIKNNEISQRFEDIKVLSEIGQKVTATVEIEEIITRVYENINKLMDAPNFEIGLINSHFKTINFSGFLGEDHKMSHVSNKLDRPHSLTTHCLNEQKIIFIKDINNEIKDYIEDADAVNKYLHGNSKSLIYIPLKLDTKIIGVLIVRSSKENAYNEVNLNILKNLAAYISIALDNAKAYSLIEQKNQHITDSINAALSIQEAILPNIKLMDNLLGNHFLLFRPKDIVSGDFYWLNKVENKTFLGVVDCTGHGVPGAFMSMIGSSLLNRIVLEKRIIDPAQILEELDKEVKLSLKHDNSKSKEGMDLGICCFEKQHDGKTKLIFSGAKISLLHTNQENAEIKVLGGDRRSVGSIKAYSNPFQNHEIILDKGAQFYITTDGIIDQNDHSRKRFGSKAFRKTILQNANLEIKKQGKKLAEIIDDFQGNEYQRDDITVIGVKI